MIFRIRLTFFAVMVLLCASFAQVDSAVATTESIAQADSTNRQAIAQDTATAVADSDAVSFVSLDSMIRDTIARDTLSSDSTVTDSTAIISTADTSAAIPKAPNPYNLPDSLMPLWNSMSIEQKAAQMIMVYMTPASFIAEHEFGGVLVMRSHLKHVEQFKQVLKSANDSLKIPLLVAVDQEGGRVNRISSIAPEWVHTPSAKAMRKMDTTEIRELSERIGAELYNAGINLNLAPVLDPAKDSRGRNSFMEETDRSWGEDTTNAPKVRAFVKGMAHSGVTCVSKHFPGYDSGTNSDHQIAISTTPKKKMAKNVEFFKALSSDIPVTMMSSVRFVRLSNRPAVFEPKIIDMVRSISSETVILTDDLWGLSLRAWISGTDRVKHKSYPAKDFKKLVQTALYAGNDMFMITYPQKAVEMVKILTSMSKKDKKAKKRIEESCARILKMKYKAGLIR